METLNKEYSKNLAYLDSGVWNISKLIEHYASINYGKEGAQQETPKGDFSLLRVDYIQKE